LQGIREGKIEEIAKGGNGMQLQEIPRFTLSDLDGNTFSTDSLKGKNTLIFMWASW
jgi:cytochrome oxidase Cu insertion factor (SCO1/SenC/PrrC family)